MIIILEGCEKTGKSTIAKELSSRINIPIFTSNVSHNRLKKSFDDRVDLFYEAFKIDQPFLLSFLQQTKYSIIQDRSYPSQFVYPQVYLHKGRVFDEKLLRWTDDEYKKLNVKIIICLKMINNETDEIVVNRDFGTIQAYYNDFIKWTNCDCLPLYTDDKNLDRQINDIEEFIK